MADILLLLAAALLTLVGGAAVLYVTRAGRHRRALEARDRPRRLRQELDDIDSLIRQVDQAASDEELDRLDNERE